MAAANAPELLAFIGRKLDEAGARWNTIGAVAVAYHGPVRASLDADALVSFKTARISAQEFAAELRREGLQVEYRDGEMGDPGFFDRGIADEPDGMKLRFASAEDLVALKLFAGGPRDLEDAAGVLAANRDSMDGELLATLCHRFGRATEGRLRRLLGG